MESISRNLNRPKRQISSAMGADGLTAMISLCATGRLSQSHCPAQANPELEGGTGGRGNKVAAAGRLNGPIPFLERREERTGRKWVASLVR
jgi:hypothetical protein